MGKTRENVSVKSDAELLSYIINQDPVLSAEIELPEQGDDNAVAKIGKLIIDNNRHKNAFINTVNVIGLTVIKRALYKNPWSFTNKGTIRAGESVREIVVNLIDSKDYNAYKNNVTNFLNNEVPNIMQYIHEINFQKFYKTTTDDVEMAMAFENEGGLFRLIDNIVGKLFDSLEEDLFLLSKYTLARRILDGTTGIEYLSDSLTTREIVAKLKGISNKMSFINGDYNPAGYEYASPIDNQRTIFDCDFEGRLTAEVLATSYFRNDADMETRKVLTNGFGFTNSELKRLHNLLNLAKEASVLTDTEKTLLASIKAVICDIDFFQEYTVALGLDGVGDKTRVLENPETLKTNHWLHAWRVISSSPYAHIVAVTTGSEPTITAVTVKLNGSSVADGGTFNIANFTAGTMELATEITVTGTNIYNKAYSVEITDTDDRLKFNAETGQFSIEGGATALDASVTITSIGDNSVDITFAVTTTLPV